MQDETIAREDYKFIKEILKASKNKEDNCEVIGIFEMIFVKDNSIKRNMDENVYRKKILPIMTLLKDKEEIIEEAEIYIQDQELKVWRIANTL